MFSRPVFRLHMEHYHTNQMVVWKGEKIDMMQQLVITPADHILLWWVKLRLFFVDPVWAGPGRSHKPPTPHHGESLFT